MTARGNYRLVVFGPGIRKLGELISPQLYGHVPLTKAYRTLTMPGPTASAHQVLVYSGPGVSPLSLSHTILTLSLLLLPHYTVQPITPNTLATQPWEPACALLVIPGGRDLPYVDELTRKTRVTKRIREYVLEGGSFLGICAGAYFGSSRVEFDLGGDMEVKGDRELVSKRWALEQAKLTEGFLPRRMRGPDLQWVPLRGRVWLESGQHRRGRREASQHRQLVLQWRRILSSTRDAVERRRGARDIW